MRISKDSISKHVAAYRPKAVVVLVDELSEVMNDSNFKLVNSIQSSLGSIARLGRAAGVSLCLATQRPSSNVINADLKNNIQMSCLLGDFDAGASSLLFEKDMSSLSKPEIKGRGFLKSGKDIHEFQAYWTERKKDFLERGQTEVKINSSSNSKKAKRVKQKRQDKVEHFKQHQVEQVVKHAELEQGYQLEEKPAVKHLLPQEPLDERAELIAAMNRARKARGLELEVEETLAPFVEQNVERVPEVRLGKINIKMSGQVQDEQPVAVTKLKLNKKNMDVKIPVDQQPSMDEGYDIVE